MATYITIRIPIKDEDPEPEGLNDHEDSCMCPQCWSPDDRILRPNWVDWWDE